MLISDSHSTGAPAMMAKKRKLSAEEDILPAMPSQASSTTWTFSCHHFLTPYSTSSAQATNKTSAEQCPECKENKLEIERLREERKRDDEQAPKFATSSSQISKNTWQMLKHKATNFSTKDLGKISSNTVFDAPKNSMRWSRQPAGLLVEHPHSRRT
jgi:hypothetical protein